MGWLPWGRAVRLHSKDRRRPRYDPIRDGATRTRTPPRTPAHPRRPLVSRSASGARSRQTIRMPRPGRSTLGPTITPATCRLARAGIKTASNRPLFASPGQTYSNGSLCTPVRNAKLRVGRWPKAHRRAQLIRFASPREHRFQPTADHDAPARTRPLRDSGEVGRHSAELAM